MEKVDENQQIFLDRSFTVLPNYARFLLESELEQFVRRIVHNSISARVPILRYFASYEEEDLIKMAMESNTKLLLSIAGNTVGQYLEQAKITWLKNELPVITRDQVLAEDITLISFVRRKVFREMLPSYSPDPEKWLPIMEEVDRFTVIVDSFFINAFIALQQRRIEKANEELNHREQQLLEAQSIGKIGSFEWDFDGRKSHNSPQVYSIFEMADDEQYPFERFMSFVHPEDRTRVRAALEKSLETGEYRCEYRYRNNENEKYILARGKIMYENDKPVRMVGTIMDLTEKQAIIKRLQESELRNKQAQALTHIGNWSLDPRTGEMEWSDELYRIFGLEPQSEKVTLDSIKPFFHSDQGKQIAIGLRHARRSRQVPESHFRIARRDGGAKIIKGKGEAITGENGTVVRIVGTVQDVTNEFLLTERLKERERYLDELNRSLAQKNEQLTLKNRELESFNFIASHDLQEPLRKIQVYSNRILEEHSPSGPPGMLADFERIRSAAGRMQKLIDDFLAFSQTINSPRTFESINLETIVDEARAELQTRISDKGARIRCKDLSVVQAIPFQMKQLFINLISNSLKYSHPERSPEIVIESMQQGDESPSNQLKIKYSDNGIGFDQKYAEKVFQLFQRLHNKNQYSGTGIGLALCRKICENHNGTITVSSEPMKGTTFVISLPR